MTVRQIGPLLCCGLLAVALMSASTPATAKPKTVNCSPTTLKILSSTLFTNTLSTNYVDISEATLSFRQGGASASCVILRFSAEVSAKDNAVTVRPLMDVDKKAFPPEVAFGGMECIPTVGCTTRSHAFEFVFPKVTPGTHLVRMQFKAAFVTEFPAFIGNHNLVVQYAP
jgi:hypothetical protein